MKIIRLKNATVKFDTVIDSKEIQVEDGLLIAHEYSIFQTDSNSYRIDEGIVLESKRNQIHIHIADNGEYYLKYSVDKSFLKELLE